MSHRSRRDDLRGASSPDEGSNGYGSDLRLGGNCLREVDHFRYEVGEQLGGAPWSRIAAAMSIRNQKAAQKRHADLSRRCPRPPAMDFPP